MRRGMENEVARTEFSFPRDTIVLLLFLLPPSLFRETSSLRGILRHPLLFLRARAYDALCSLFLAFPSSERAAKASRQDIARKKNHLSPYMLNIFFIKSSFLKDSFDLQ